MKRILITTVLLTLTLMMWAQSKVNPFEELKKDPKKSFGTDYPYGFVTGELTKTPDGYEPFYISQYARHGSRYYWNDGLYKQLDTLLNAAHTQKILTAEGEAFYQKFEEAKEELMTGISELTQLGWEQHQTIARRMYNRFPEVLGKGGDILAISSLSGRCVLSMSAYCQELTQCNPKLEIREQSSRFTLDGVVPDDKENPALKTFEHPRPKYEKNRGMMTRDNSLNQKILERVFVNPAEVPNNVKRIAGSLVSLYTSLPNIGHEGMMGNIITEDEIVAGWENSNLGSYSWVFGLQYAMIPILEDIITKADGAIAGTNTRVADLRFGHDACIGPLTVLMGLAGADLDPEDPSEVKYIYQNWQTCKACNIQLIFYRSKANKDDVLVKCLLNESEVTLPVKTDNFPYYKWSDVRAFYLDRCQQHAGK